MDAARTYNAKLAGLSGIPAADGGWDAIDGSMRLAQLRAKSTCACSTSMATA